MMYFVIPARKGSKGFPGKNRKLLDYTLNSLHEDCQNIIVTTDDDEILERTQKYITIKRSAELSNDNASMKDVLLDVIDNQKLKKDDVIVMLYLTYPQRTWTDILRAIEYFGITHADSMLCRKQPQTHPFLCIYNDGSQIVKHNLYRRQDYPDVWEISHFIFIALAKEIKNLNNNLYNYKTVYYAIDDKVNIDYEKDLDKL